MVHLEIKVVLADIEEASLEQTVTELKSLGGNVLGAKTDVAKRNDVEALAEKTIDMIIFFRDPLDKHPHEPDVQMLMRLCDVHNIPLATNPATAELLLKGISIA